MDATAVVRVSDAAQPKCGVNVTRRIAAASVSADRTGLLRRQTLELSSAWVHTGQLHNASWTNPQNLLKPLGASTLWVAGFLLNSFVILRASCRRQAVWISGSG